MLENSWGQRAPPFDKPQIMGQMFVLCINRVGSPPRTQWGVGLPGEQEGLDGLEDLDRAPPLPDVRGVLARAPVVQVLGGSPDRVSRGMRTEERRQRQVPGGSKDFAGNDIFPIVYRSANNDACDCKSIGLSETWSWLRPKETPSIYKHSHKPGPHSFPR